MGTFQIVCLAIVIGSLILATIACLLAIVVLTIIALFTGQVSWGDVGVFGIYTVVTVILAGAFQ